MQQGRFGQFQFQPFRIESALGQRLQQFRPELAVAKLHRRQVDRHAQLAPAGPMPGSALAAGLLQHPAPDRRDQSAFLGHADEGARLQQAPLRVVPAQ